MISLQREKKRKHELKAGISYEGWERVAKDRWATRGKRAFLSAADGGSFLKEWSADLATSCDHAKVSEVIWSSDGASWLKEGPGLFSCTHAQAGPLPLEEVAFPRPGVLRGGLPPFLPGLLRQGGGGHLGPV
jgi:hypothetical protein